MSDKGQLSHHEALRLDYLKKNIHYLNDKEKRELAYLTALSHDNGTRQSSLPHYPNRQRRSRVRHLSNQRVAETSDNQNLPRYNQAPRQPRKIKPSLRKSRWKSVLKWLTFALLLTFVGLIFMFFKGYNGARQEVGGTVTEKFNGVDSPDGTNILILGTDQRVSQDSTEARTDSVMVLNVGGKDGQLKLVSFMRDTLVNIEGVSQGEAYDQKLNAAFTLGENAGRQGAEVIREVLKKHYDIDIKYYAMVDFESFASAIDKLFPDGVTIDAQFATVDGEDVNSVEVPDDLRMENGVVPNQTIVEGLQQMDGRTLLNYARFRKDDEGDYGRTRRQQQVMTAILQQVKNPMRLFTGAEAAGHVFGMTSTNIPLDFMITGGWLVVTNAGAGISQTTIPENGDWIDEYDAYDGLGLLVDFPSYQNLLSQLGFR